MRPRSILAQTIAVLQIEAAVGVNRELGVLADLLKNRLSLAVSSIGRAADLHLHDIVATIEVAAHLATQHGEVLAGIAVTAGDARIGLTSMPLLPAIFENRIPKPPYR